MQNTSKSNIMMVPKIDPFEIVITKGDITVNPRRGNPPIHIHNHFEIFINVTGNIDFIVKNKIYTLSHGDILLIEPNIYHHSIYKHVCHNEYYYIFFPVFNDVLFRAILNLDDDADRMIRLPSETRDEFLRLCDKLYADGDNEYRYLTFFKMLDILFSFASEPSKEKPVEPHLAQITDIMNYINENYNTIVSLDDVANEFHISLKTMERLFKKHLDTTPKCYTDMLRLSKSSELLRKDFSVTEACYKSGFQDCSQFIRRFKQQFGETPLQYKKRFLNSINNAYYLQESMNR